MSKIVTCTAPVNIAVIKYWGKRDEELVLPLNDSVSFTLSQDEMCAKTTVMISPNFICDKLWLNQKEQDIDHPRILNCLKEVRRRSSKRKLSTGSQAQETFDPNWCVHICSENNFPTAAGLASSAAGYACLVFALGKLFGLEGDLSSVARLGSGSACRSLEGGIVQWHSGVLDDGTDSIATQVAPRDHWGDLHVIICVAGSGHKKTSSTEGMRRSVQTSNFLRIRTQESVPVRTQCLIEAVFKKNWSTFCDLTMKDSNEMHAVCLDTFPPCVYMNDTSHAVSALVHAYNDLKVAADKTEEMVCYTFDAGPNACIFVPGQIVNEFAAILNQCFSSPYTGNPNNGGYWRGIPLSTSDVGLDFQALVASRVVESHSIKYFIHTKVGEGPQVLPDQDSVHLLDRTTGLPNRSIDTGEVNGL